VPSGAVVGWENIVPELVATGVAGAGGTVEQLVTKAMRAMTISSGRSDLRIGVQGAAAL
jgi:hypothetical protein